MAQQKGFTLGGIGAPCCCTTTPAGNPACGCTITQTTLTLSIVHTGGTGLCYAFLHGTTTATLTFGTPPSYTGISAGWFGTFTGGSGGPPRTIVAVLNKNTGAGCNLGFWFTDTLFSMCNTNVSFASITCSPLNIVFSYSGGGAGCSTDCFPNVGLCGGDCNTLTLTITP